MEHETEPNVHLKCSCNEVENRAQNQLELRCIGPETTPNTAENQSERKLERDSKTKKISPAESTLSLTGCDPFTYHAI